MAQPPVELLKLLLKLHMQAVWVNTSACAGYMRALCTLRMQAVQADAGTVDAGCAQGECLCLRGINASLVRTADAGDAGRCRLCAG
eukprot:1157804-Pelagomonas_calceolata.AAC.4